MSTKDASAMPSSPASATPQDQEELGKVLHILIVEDNAADAVLARQMLSEDKSVTYDVSTADRVSQAKDALAAQSFDVVLLDLSLPDAHDLEGLAALLADRPSQAIVVLTGQDDETLGLSAIHRGAQDYLVKNRLTADLLTRSLRYAMERGALQRRLEMANLQELREHEITALQSISRDPAIGPTKRRFKSRSLKEVAPKIFNEFVSGYEAIFGTAINEQAYKVQASAADQLRALAEKLCRYRVGSKDVIDIHLAVLERRVAVDGLTPCQIVSLTNEARVVLLQILGFVAEGYRAYAMSFGVDVGGQQGEPEDK